VKTLATKAPQGWPASWFYCTHDADGLIDAECGQDAVVVVLEDGEWLGEALCAKHSHPSFGVTK